MRLPVYLDECVDYLVVAELRTRGFQVTSAKDQGTLGFRDDAHLPFAAENAWVLVTHNNRDFWRLNNEYGRMGLRHAGILLLSHQPIEVLVLRIAMLIDWIAEDQQLVGQLLRWNDLQKLLIEGKRLPGYNNVDLSVALGRRAV